MSAVARVRAQFEAAGRRRSIRLLGASGQLGYGIPTPTFEAGLAREPDLIGCAGGLGVSPAQLVAAREALEQ